MAETSLLANQPQSTTRMRDAPLVAPASSLGAIARRRRAGWLIVALAAAVGYSLLPYVSGLLGGPIVAVVGAPWYRWLRTRIGARAAALTVTVAALLLLLIPGVVLVAGLAAQAPATLGGLAASAWYRRLETLRLGPFDVGPVLAASGGEVSRWLSRQAGTILGNLTDTALNLLVALFGAYYTLTAGHRIWSRVAAHLPFERATTDRLRQRFHDVTEAMILGVLATALVQGTVVGGAFALVRLPHALFWGFVTGCVSILPVLGSALVWLPGSLVLALDARYGAAATLFAIGAVVASNLDNVVRPIVYRRISDVHPMVTLVGAFAGVRLFGLAGLLLGPLAISYLIELVSAVESEHRPV